MKRDIHKIVTIILLFVSNTAYTQLQLPTFFSSNMVLQQKTNNAIWGISKANEEISIITSWGETKSIKADKVGKWKVFITTPSYRTGQTIIIKDSNSTVTLKNVAVGEVWLCLGQSNMGWSLGNCFNWDEESQNTDNDQLRIYKSDRQNWYEPREDCSTGRWCKSDMVSASRTSAVSWYFGNTLQKALEIPVGIIVQAYAGTPIESWLPWDAQKEIERSIKHKFSLDETHDRQILKLGLTKESALKKYNEEVLQYKRDIATGDTMKSKNKRKMYPIITKPAQLGNQYPSNIYNAMVHPLLGYGIKGIIWYQGERNSKTVQQASDYKEQLQCLINYYRDSWYTQSEGNVDGNFYFSYTQLPSWGPEQKNSVESIEAPWTVSRNVMLELVKEMNNVGMAVSIDTGDAFELHPKNKKPIGLRHAYNVLHDVYGINNIGHGPYYKSHKIVKHTIEITFDGCGGGLMAAYKEALNSFAIAGNDHKWKWAKATIIGNKVIVFSDEVKNPVAVRYAWAMNPSQRNLLYNKEGFPASPFKTDNWPLFEKDAPEIKVEKPIKDKSYKAKDWYRPEMNP